MCEASILTTPGDIVLNCDPGTFQKHLNINPFNSPQFYKLGIMILVLLMRYREGVSNIHQVSLLINDGT